MKQLGKITLGLATAASLLFSFTAGATVEPAPPKKHVLVKCESIDKKYRVCGVPGPAIQNVKVHEQLSNTDCKKNKNWGFDNHSIWVDDGCRAIFDATLKIGGGNPNQPDYQDLQCSSINGNYRECKTDLHGIFDVIVLQKQSNAPCQKYYSFGWTYDRVWVDNGCRAIFRAYGY